MARESSKSRSRFEKFLTGRGIDIGCGPDPVTETCDTWDLSQGDAQEMKGAQAESYDWVWSSHCIEHLRNPQVALHRWWSLVKPGGYLIILAPEFTSYEHSIWPSIFNPDHKAAFVTSQDGSTGPAVYNFTDLVHGLTNHMLVRLERVVTEEPNLEDPQDTTLSDGLAQVEVVLQKLIPTPVRSRLMQLFACPRCYREIIAVGRTPEGKLSCRCTRCGTTGTYEL